MIFNQDKIIFTGPMGAGKTTAIASISDSPPVTTEVDCSGEEKKLKSSTTVAMDYSYIELPDGKRIHLYGTPGQERFSFMWKILCNGGMGLVLLINHDQKDSVLQMERYLDAFGAFIDETAVVIGITRADSQSNQQNGLHRYHELLAQRGSIYPVFDIDARKSSDVKILVQALLAELQVKA